MIALDTNVLARYLLRDDETQFQQASKRIASDAIYTAPITVILELVWVLRANGCEREDILKALRLLLGLPNFKPMEFESLCYALGWYEQGLDFADALHLALSTKQEKLLSFDKSLIAQSAKASTPIEVSLP